MRFFFFFLVRFEFSDYLNFTDLKKNNNKKELKLREEYRLTMVGNEKQRDGNSQIIGIFRI